jgi:hypothetical protein
MCISYMLHVAKDRLSKCSERYHLLLETLMCLMCHQAMLDARHSKQHKPAASQVVGSRWSSLNLTAHRSCSGRLPCTRSGVLAVACQARRSLQIVLVEAAVAGLGEGTKAILAATANVAEAAHGRRCT